MSIEVNKTDRIVNVTVEKKYGKSIEADIDIAGQRVGFKQEGEANFTYIDLPKLEFDDLTQAQKDSLKLTFDQLTQAEKDSLKGSDANVTKENIETAVGGEVALINNVKDTILTTENYRIIAGKSNVLPVGDGKGIVLISTYDNDELKNRITGIQDLRTIIGGYDCEISGGTNSEGLACVIFGSHHSDIIGSTANHGTIVGGSYNKINAGAYSGIFSGSGNVIKGTADNGSTILGGVQNTVSNSGAVNVGGTFNNVSGNTALNYGGNSNAVSGNLSVNIGGASNIVTGQNSANITGDTNEVTNSYSVNLGGLSNRNNSQYSKSHGRSNLINSGADYSSVKGQNNEIASNAVYSSAQGLDGIAHVRGSNVMSNGKITNKGDVQIFTVPLRRRTTDANITPLRPSDYIDISVRTNTAWVFTGSIIAYDGADSSGFEVKGVCMNNNGILTFVGTPTSTSLGNTSGAATWSLTVSKSGTSLRLNAKGESGKNINWSCTLNVSESGI